MAKSKISREERMSEIQDKLLAGIKEIYESGKWSEYIAVMSKFPKYSLQGTTQGRYLTGGGPPVRFSM